MSYDQWKTASPYDDEIDFAEEAEKWLKRHKADQDSKDEHIHDTYWLIEGLVNLLDEL